MIYSLDIYETFTRYSLHIHYYFTTYVAVTVNEPLEPGNTYVSFVVSYLDDDTRFVSAWYNPVTTQPAMGTDKVWSNYFVVYKLMVNDMVGSHIACES